MKRVRLTSLFGAAVIALAFFAVSCKKSSSSSSSSGTFSFKLNGSQVNMVAVTDSTIAGGAETIYIDAYGVLPGTKDSAYVQWMVQSYEMDTTAASFGGYYTDSSASQIAGLSLLDIATHVEYADSYSSYEALSVNVLSNNGKQISGNFQGTLYNTAGQDSVIVTNGVFNLPLQ